MKFKLLWGVLMIAIENVPVTEDEKEQVYNRISDILHDLHDLSEYVERIQNDVSVAATIGDMLIALTDLTPVSQYVFDIIDRINMMYLSSECRKKDTANDNHQ